VHSSSLDPVPLFIVKSQTEIQPVVTPPLIPKLQKRSLKSAELLSSAERLKKEGDHELAEGLMRQSLSLDSTNESILRLLIDSLYAREAKAPERLRLSEIYYRMSPKSVGAFYYGRELSAIGELERARELFFEATLAVSEETQMIFEVYKEIGNIAVRQADLDLAEEYYHKALSVDPQADRVHVNLGTVEIQRAQWDRARDHFSKALEHNPKNDKAWVGSALALYNLNQIELAMANLQNALDYNSRNRTAIHLLAAWSRETGEIDIAFGPLTDYLSESTMDEEFDVEMSCVLIQLFLEKQKFNEAEIEVERALLFYPEREDLLDVLTQLQEKTAQ
jgi:tetratricopeptide (TPR) repeat protein